MKLVAGLFALALTACVACTHPTPNRPGVCDRVYIVSSEFTPTERALYEQATEHWNQLALERHCLTTGENEEHGVRRMHYGSPEWQALSAEFNGANILGVYRHGPDSITIVDNLQDWEFWIVALHEQGHSRGLKHVDPEDAVMHASLGAKTASDFTPADKAECRRVSACSSEVQVLTYDDSENEVCVLVRSPAVG